MLQDTVEPFLHRLTFKPKVEVGLVHRRVRGDEKTELCTKWEKRGGKRGQKLQHKS